MIGQYFTPQVVAHAIYRMVGTFPGARVVDPSCGDGVFVTSRPDGVEMFACELDRQYALPLGSLFPKGNFVWGDALTELSEWEGTFDLAIGNPPFSAQRNLENRTELLRTFDLGVSRKRQCLEVLFLELFVRLVKPGGRVAIILPDGPLGNGPFRYVRQWLLEHTKVEMILSLPRKTFSSTEAKTSVLILQKLVPGTAAEQGVTWTRCCQDLAELEEMKVPEQNAANGWIAVHLANEKDWRPEAHVGSDDNMEGMMRLGDLFSIRTGSAKYGALRELFDESGGDRLLLIRAKNLASEGGLKIDPANDDVAYISRSGAMFNPNAVLDAGEILFVRVGAGCYGRTALVPRRLKAQADDWIHVLTPNAGVDGAGLVAWLNSDGGRARIKRLAKGVGTVSISGSALAALPIPAAFAPALG